MNCAPCQRGDHEACEGSPCACFDTTCAEAEFERLKTDPGLTDEDGKDALYRHAQANDHEAR